jgi:hypothetical protein
MALIFSVPPEESLDALRSAAEDNPGYREVAGAAFDEAGSADPMDLLPHRIYTAGLTDLAKGKWNGKAQLVGWRYLLQRDGTASFSAEVNVVSGEHTFSQLNQGPFVGQTADLVEKAEQSGRVEDGSYELNVLRIPALYVMALWLRNMENGGDIVIPMGPTIPELEPGREYDLDEISLILAKAAQARLSFDDTPRS